MKRACVIGWPIEHSRSPIIHGYWLRTLGIAGTYTREPVKAEELEDFLSTLGARGFAGCNVTVPHKEAVLGLVDDASEAARSIGAANTLWFESGKLKGMNTDVAGFLANLDQEALDVLRRLFDRLRRLRLLLLGASDLRDASFQRSKCCGPQARHPGELARRLRDAHCRRRRGHPGRRDRKSVV